MAPQKTRAIVLQVRPYRESSGIVYLYTEDLGLVHGIARGIRRGGKQARPLERGVLLECLVYGHPHRSLHTLGSYAVAEFYPAIRGDLYRTAARDAAFELIVRSVHPDEPNASLFDYLCSFLQRLDRDDTRRSFPFALWRFYFDFAHLMGFGVDAARCGLCDAPLTDDTHCSLIAERGVMVCERCARAGNERHIPPALRLLTLDPDTPVDSLLHLPRAEQKRLTRLLAAYCRHHFDLRAELRSLEFVCEII